MRQRIVPLSRTAEKSLDVDALRSGTLACLLLSPAASLDAMHHQQQRRTNQTKTKTNYSAKNALNAAFNCAGNFFGPSHPLGKYSERRNKSIGKIFGKRSTGKIFGEKKSIGKISATFLLRSPVQRSNCTRQCNLILNLAFILPP